MRYLGLLGLVLAAACGNSGGNTVAYVAVLAPTQNLTVVQGFGVEFRFAANDPDDQAVVRVIVDGDSNPATTADETLLATLLERDGVELVYVWQTKGVAPGSYLLLYQVLETGRQPVMKPIGEVTILTAPTLSVGQGNRVIIAGTDITIGFNATDADNVATYAIYADRDCNINTTGDQIVVASGLTAQQNTVVWNTMGAPIAEYCMFITMDDGMNPVTVRQAGTITLHSDQDLIFAPPGPLVPDVSIVTKDPTSPDFYQLLWFDDLDDVDPGEMDISVTFTAQQNSLIWFGFELYSQADQTVLRDDMVYSVVLPGVGWNGMTGTLYLYTDGTAADGLAYFEEDGGPFADLVNVPVSVEADPDIAAFGFAYLFLSIPAGSFAFPIFTDDDSDFEVLGEIFRLDIGGPVLGSIDDTVPVVLRFKDDT